jgi:hypothetical protein
VVGVIGQHGAHPFTHKTCRRVTTGVTKSRWAAGHDQKPRGASPGREPYALPTSPLGT